MRISYDLNCFILDVTRLRVFAMHWMQLTRYCLLDM